MADDLQDCGVWRWQMKRQSYGLRKLLKERAARQQRMEAEMRGKVGRLVHLQYAHGNPRKGDR